MKRKMPKLAAIAAAVVILSVTTAFAAIYLDLGVLSEFFRGDSTHLLGAVQTPREQATDGQYNLTLEEVLTDNRYLFIVYSVEALTEDARAELMKADDLLYDNDFQYNISVSPNPGISGGGSGSIISMNFTPRYARELVERRTETTRYWAFYDEMPDVGAESVTLRLNTADTDLTVNVPTNTVVEAKELTLGNSLYGDVNIRLSPIGVTIIKKPYGGSDVAHQFTDVFFRMSDGQVKTFNQLAAMAVGYGMMPADESTYRYSTRFEDAIPLADFKSIIVGNTEYDLSNPANTSEVTLDANLYPFEATGYMPVLGTGFLLSVEEACAGLGAEMAWDGVTLTVELRGSVYELTNGSHAFLKDDKRVNHQWRRDLLHDIDGILYMDLGIAMDMLGIHAGYDNNEVEYIEERPTDNPEETVGIFTLTPVTPQYIKYTIIP